MTSQAEKFNQKNGVSATGQHEKGIPKGVKARIPGVTDLAQPMNCNQEAFSRRGAGDAPSKSVAEIGIIMTPIFRLPPRALSSESVRSTGNPIHPIEDGGGLHFR